MNLEIREFQAAIRSYIQGSALAPEIKRMVLAELMTEVKEQADMKVREELNKRTVKQKKDSEVKK